MCGICGVLDFGWSEPSDREILAGMNRTMKHRGPDDEGFYFDGPLGLGHRRLSIIDLSEAGRQPIHNEDQSVWIVYNGEVYNCPELRSELEAQGHGFYTRTDTEVIVHAYEQHGLDCVDRLNGMFAFALWDREKHRLFIARDRVGIKPLYYASMNGRFLFASELKAILAHPAIPRTIDPIALNQYLSYEYVPTPRTIFKDIHKLPPGCWMTVEQDGRLRIHQYWDCRLDRSESATAKTEADHVAELREVLKESVRKELISDVPTGVLLSGGIDSSAVAAMMAIAMPGRVQSFSISFEDKSFDESSYARTVADHVGADHHEMMLSPARMLDLIPRIAQFLDEPLGDSSIIPTYLLSEFTQQHVKVALGGDGGDELFAGYSTHQAHKGFGYYERFVPQALRAQVIPTLVKMLPVSFNNISMDFKARRFVSGHGCTPVVRHHLWLGSFNQDQKKALLAPSYSDGCDGIEDPAARHLAACSSIEQGNQILYCDLKLYLEGDILPKVDRASMARSLEVRVPLLNHLVLEFAERLPYQWKLHGFTTKYLLRKAMEGILPESILRRGKKGFNMPVAAWLTGPLKPLARQLLDPERLRDQGFFDPPYVQHLLQEHLDRRNDNRKLLWTLMVFQLWLERWA